MRVLSIAGGGVRGIYAAAYLDELERGFASRRGMAGLDIGKAVDLIVGTSTGAIIGCGLAVGQSPAELMKLYREHARYIFPKKLPSRVGPNLLMQLFTRRKHLRRGDWALRRALSALFKETSIRQLWEQRGIALAIPAVNMGTYGGWVFKTPHSSKSDHRDDDTTIVDVCLASTAAPLFRSLALIEHENTSTYDVFADGGLWANNPVLVALVEALAISCDNDEKITIFSLGTCGKPEGEIIERGDLHRGLTGWTFGGEAASVSIAAQEFAFDMIARFLLPHLQKKVRIVRFPSDKIPGALLEYLDMDETRPKGLDALVGQARQDAHMTNRQIAQGTEDGGAIKDLFDSMPLRAGNHKE